MTTLIQNLLDENSGYNPENAPKGAKLKGAYLFVENFVYELTKNLTVESYIKNNPKQYGLIKNGKFYAEVF